jgi:hypothetical protein
MTEQAWWQLLEKSQHVWRLNCRRTTTWPAVSTPGTGKIDFAISRRLS